MENTRIEGAAREREEGREKEGGREGVRVRERDLTGRCNRTHKAQIQGADKPNLALISVCVCVCVCVCVAGWLTAHTRHEYKAPTTATATIPT